MKIIISNNKSKPIYEQITEQIKTSIMSGQLSPGEKIPSMRALAKMLRVSTITVQKAYEDLQADGFIETSIGKGSYVLQDNIEFIKEEQQKQIEEHLKEAVIIARKFSIEEERLLDLIKILYNEDE